MTISHFQHQAEIRVHETKSGLLEEDRAPTPPQRLLGLLAMLAGLFHDLGKANAKFQAKLRNPKPEADAIRHELVSVLMLDQVLGFADLKDDGEWLEVLASEDGRGWERLQPRKAKKPKLFETDKVSSNRNDALIFPSHEKTPLLYALCWLVVSHHRLPYHDGHSFTGEKHLNLGGVTLPGAYAKLGQLEPNPDTKNAAPWQCPKFLAQVADLAKRLRSILAEKPELPSLDALMLYGRLGFQMADHGVSSAHETIGGLTVAKDTPGLFANTIKQSGQSYFRQRLPDHLLRVSKEAGQTVRLLFGLEKRLPRIAYEDLPGKLRTATTAERFQWQDDAARWVRELPDIAEAGLFAVVMAGTGSGKTIGCPKIMAAASNGLRLVYASALRSLTLQTGTALRDDLGFGPEAMAVKVGSDLVKRLYEMEQDEETKRPFEYEAEGVASSGFDEEFELDGGGYFELDPKLEALLNDLFKEQKVREYLTVPLLSSTLDSIMKIADARRGGHIAHALRVLSSDVILDEIDLYGPEDLAAIGRLVFQLGLAGRKLAIASATIPPPLARHLFAAYHAGCIEHGKLFGKAFPVYAGWFAEDCGDNKALRCESAETFNEAHAAFVQARMARLQTKEPRRVIRRFAIPSAKTKESMFDAVFEACLELHQAHHTIDPETGQRVSIGAVQWGRVSSCMDFCLHAARLPVGEVAYFLVCHHARFALAVRHFVERDLDAMLRRKDDGDLPLKHPAIREALANAQGKDVMVIVSTTLESTGRDHDFDWGVVEPVSARTVAQFAGRIHRHRDGLAADNLIVMAYPMRHIENKQEGAACYYKPGPEDTGETKHYRLNSPEAVEVLPDKIIDARLSIRDFGFPPSKSSPVRAGLLAELEQQVLEDRLDVGLAKAYLAKPQQKLSSNPSDQHIFRRTEKQVLFWVDEFDNWRACRDEAFERFQLVGDALTLIKGLPEERFLLHHGLEVSLRYQKLLEDLQENDSPTMRCLLLGITYRAGSGPVIPPIRFHELLGLDKSSS